MTRRRGSRVTSLLEAQRFEQILALPVAHAHVGEARGWTCSDWSLRTHDTTFVLVSWAEARRLIPRCFSIGWGLCDGTEGRDLLQLQAIGEPAEIEDLRALLVPLLSNEGGDICAAVTTVSEGTVLRLSGSIGGRGWA